MIVFEPAESDVTGRTEQSPDALATTALTRAARMVMVHVKTPVPTFRGTVTDRAYTTLIYDHFFIPTEREAVSTGLLHGGSAHQTRSTVRPFEAAEFRHWLDFSAYLASAVDPVAFNTGTDRLVLSRISIPLPSLVVGMTEPPAMDVVPTPVYRTQALSPFDRYVSPHVTMSDPSGVMRRTPPLATSYPVAQIN